jgi:hypothetical protein
MNQNDPLEPIHPLSENAQSIDIFRISIVLVAVIHQLPQTTFPSDLADTSMLPAKKVRLDGIEHCNHSPFQLDPSNGEGAVLSHARYGG